MIPKVFKWVGRRQLILMLTLPVAMVAILRLINARSAGTADLGVRDGHLAPCGDQPNCVGSQGTDPGHQIEPLHIKGTMKEARRQVLDLLTSLPRTRLVTQRPDYLHVEFKSFVFGFVDDVEFQFVEGGNIIHVRSASRLGHSDLGVNRRRVEMIRRRLGW
jgi:uncharacterized protein (DUF1499 family)